MVSFLSDIDVADLVPPLLKQYTGRIQSAFSNLQVIEAVDESILGLVEAEIRKRTGEPLAGCPSATSPAPHAQGDARHSCVVQGPSTQAACMLTSTHHDGMPAGIDLEFLVRDFVLRAPPDIVQEGSTRRR